MSASRTMSLRAPDLAIASLLVVLGSACLRVGPLTPAGNYIETFEHQTNQAALVAAPSGPHASGPLVPRGRVALEASGQLTTVITSDHTRAEGMTGNVVPVGLVRARLVVGITERIELGMDGEYARASWGTTAAADTPSDAVTGELWRGGVQLRAIVAGTPRLGMGLNVEMSVGTVPTQQTTRSTVSCAPLDPTQRSDCATLTLPPPSTSAVHGSNAAAAGRFGLFGVGTPTTGVSVLGGALVQVQSAVYGHVGRAGQCVVYPGEYGPGICSGDIHPPNGVDFGVIAALTPWLAASYTTGPLTFIAQVHANVTAPFEIMWVSPVGMDLTARVTF